MINTEDSKLVSTVLFDFIHNIKRGINFTYTKFGDGECICMSNNYSVGMTNCDGQAYSKDLSDRLFNAANFFNRNPYVFIGEWSEEPHKTQLSNLLKSKGIRRFQYVSYCTLLHVYEQSINESRRFYNTIKDSENKKYYIGNKNMSCAAKWLGAELIEVPSSNAFNEYENIKSKLLKIVKDNDIFLYSAGLMSKVLIHDILSHNENTTHLDIGSGLDNVFLGITRDKQIDTMYLKQFYQIPL